MFPDLTTQELPAQRFYQKYWQHGKIDISTKDPTTPKRLKLLFDTLKKEGPIQNILDAGCGSGFFTEAIHGGGYRGVGIDISMVAIAEAKKRYPGIEFFCNPLDSQWPFEDKTFDAIFSTEVIEHVLDTYKMISEMNRVLKVKGVLILTTPYHGLLKNLMIVLFRFDRHFNNIEGGHIRFFTKTFLTAFLQKFGFDVMETKYIGRIRPVSKSIYIVARKTRDLC